MIKKDQCQAQKRESGALSAQCSAPAVMLRGQSKCLGYNVLVRETKGQEWLLDTVHLSVVH